MMAVQVSTWHRRDYGADDRLHWDDTGVNLQACGLNLTAHVGPNKLNRYSGFEAGCTFKCVPAAAFSILTIWFYHWTLNIGATWKDRRSECAIHHGPN